MTDYRFVRELVHIGGNADGKGAETDPHFVPVSPLRGRKFQLSRAPDAAMNLQFQHVKHANEPGHEFVDRLFINLPRSANLLQVPFGKNDDPVRNFHRLLLIVRHEQGGHIQIGVQPHQPLAKFLPNLGVDRPQRFIQEQDAGFGGQSAGNRHPLTLPAGELMRKSLLQFLKAEQFQQFCDARFGVGGFPFLNLQSKGNVLEHSHVLEQRVILKNKTDVPLLDFDIVDPLPAHEDVAVGGHFQSSNQAQHSRFAAAARPKQRQQLAFTD